MERLRTVFTEIEKTLELDEVLVYPDLYERAPELYSEVRGEVLLVCINVNDPATYSWMWESDFGNPNVDYSNTQVLAKLLLCRLYNPNEDVRFAFIVTKDEYAASPSSYVILKTVVVVAMKEFPHYTEMIELDDYREREDELDLISVSYFVRSDIVR